MPGMHADMPPIERHTVHLILEHVAESMSNTFTTHSNTHAVGFVGLFSVIEFSVGA